MNETGFMQVEASKIECHFNARIFRIKVINTKRKRSVHISFKIFKHSREMRRNLYIQTQTGYNGQCLCKILLYIIR